MTKVTQSTLLLELDTGNYPVRTHSLRRNPRLKNKLIPREPTVDQINSLGFVVVHPTPRPEADVVSEGEPIQATEDTVIEGVDVVVGEYYQQWESRSFNEGEIAQRVESKKNELLSQLKSATTNMLYNGLPYTFPGNIVNHIQLRDGDRANITGLRVGAEADIRMMEVDPEYTPRSNLGFRTFENQFFPMTPEQIVDLSDYAFAVFNAVKGIEWMYEGLIKNSETLEDLNAIDIEDIKQEMYNVQVD